MPKRYKYSMRHQCITRMKIGQIMPTFCKHVLPGDIWNGQQTGLIRVDPLALPAYVTFDVDTYFFYVKFRDIDDNFEDIYTGKSAADFPVIVTGPTTNISLLTGALGLGNADGTNTRTICAYPVRVYNKIVHEFFRKETPTYAEDSAAVLQALHKPGSYIDQWTDDFDQGLTETINTGGATLDIREVTNAVTAQKYKELKARYGEDYEDVLALQGLYLSDASLDRPEFCGKGGGMLGVSEIVATASETGGDQLGDFVGHAVGGVSTNFKSRMFLEPGMIMGLTVVRPRNQFQNKVDKDIWSPFKSDFIVTPETQVQSHQIVQRQEVSSTTTSGTYGDIIAYEPKFQHLRQAQDMICSEMTASNMHDWTGARNWETQAITLDDVHTCNSVDYDHLFQDTSPTFKLSAFFSNKIGKQSFLKPTPRL